MRVVVRIGGSVVASPISTNLISEYVEVLLRLRKEKHEVSVVVGGGSLAREFIRISRDLGLDENAQDEVAISVSRLFAQLFLMKIGKAGCKTVPRTVEEAAVCLKNEKIVIMGGLRPGMTTDAVAALLAIEVKADMIVKATDQEGVYDRDPREYPDAVKLDHVSIKDLSCICSESKHKAGLHQIIDPEAVKILKKQRIRMIVVNGFEPENVRLATEGEKIGTIID